jgi:hypothetical protein
MKKKPQLVMVQNLFGTPQTKYNLQGSGMIKFPKAIKIKMGRNRNIYA